MVQAMVLAPWTEWFYLAAVCLIAVVVGAVLGTGIMLLVDRQARKKAASPKEKQA